MSVLTHLQWHTHTHTHTHTVWLLGSYNCSDACMRTTKPVKSTWCYVTSMRAEETATHDSSSVCVCVCVCVCAKCSPWAARCDLYAPSRHLLCQHSTVGGQSELTHTVHGTRPASYGHGTIVTLLNLYRHTHTQTHTHGQRHASWLANSLHTHVVAVKT